jgi:hypothetical protein
MTDEPITRAVLVISGFSPNAHCAVHECCDICKGYGLVVDEIIEDCREPVN